MTRVTTSFTSALTLALGVALCGATVAAGQTAAQGFPGGAEEALGPGYSLSPRAQLPKHPSQGARSAIAHWNTFAVDMSGLDHTPVQPGESRVFGEQFGPTRSSRAMAIVHIAVFEVVNAIDRRYKSYAKIDAAKPGTSMHAAIAQAAHDTLLALYPSQQPALDRELAAELATIQGDTARALGVALGRNAASTVLAMRTRDRSDIAEPVVGVDFITDNAPGSWRKDPIGQGPLALGAYWGEVKPFVLQSGSQFRAPKPPALGSKEYSEAFAEVKAYGGDGLNTDTIRSPEQTLIGTYWAYDGTPSLCAPPRLYNQIAMQVADRMGTDGVDLARLLALVNTAMADAGIAIWESKYHYELWRPVTGIRESDPGTGPTGKGDGNRRTQGDPSFTPLGAPASNLTGPNFTPPFPSYPSGHAGFGGALFETLRRFYGRDDIAFTFISDELNGVTVDRKGDVRPLVPRSFASFSQAEEENGQSRIYLGIHWSFDKTAGIEMGRRIAQYVFKRAFEPLR